MTFLSSDRIVVTGIGVISPIGSDIDTFRRNIESGTKIVHDGHPAFTGHIDDFGPLSKETKRLIRKSLKLMNRETQLGVAAASHAINDGELLEAGYEADRIGVVFGAGNVEIRQADFAAGVEACREAIGQFDMAAWGNLGIPNVDPLWILRVLPNMPACHFAIAHDFRGPCNTITQAGAATNLAINEARNAILDGDADAMIVGGTGTNFSQSVTESVDAPAEAAGAFVLERLESAVSRNAKMYGEILSCSSVTMISRDHRAFPEEATKCAVTDALQQSGATADCVNHINSDCRFDDPGELAISNFARVVSLKERTGDAAAGSSALEIAECLLSLQSCPAGNVAVNVNALRSGLASCVVMGGVPQRRAA